MPDDLYEFAEDSLSRGLKGIVAGAGGAAHLPGMLAAKTTVPIFGVPIPSKHLNGEDSLYSIVQMPKGIPVATFAIGKPGAINAALHLVSILSLTDDFLREQLDLYREKQTIAAKSMNFNLGES
jgi:5-(carboxyamino)imidazole ribonucleotide mutase